MQTFMIAARSEGLHTIPQVQHAYPAIFGLSLSIVGNINSDPVTNRVTLEQ